MTDPKFKRGYTTDESGRAVRVVHHDQVNRALLSQRARSVPLELRTLYRNRRQGLRVTNRPMGACPHITWRCRDCFFDPITSTVSTPLVCEFAGGVVVLFFDDGLL
jgi:hypothetical protein